MSTVPSLKMNNGLEIPQLGFGVFLVPPEETQEAVAEALKADYRLIDTAQGYRNEEGVGAAIAESDVPREELFITSKLTNSEHGYDSALAAFEGSMQKLGIEVLDLFLIHWPLPMFDQYVETWRAFEKLLAKHWPTLRRVGLAADVPSIIYRGSEGAKAPIFVELLNWKDADGAKTAHEFPEVMAVWEPMGKLCEARGGRPSMEFPLVEPLKIKFEG